MIDKKFEGYFFSRDFKVIYFFKMELHIFIINIISNNIAEYLIILKSSNNIIDLTLIL